MSTNVSFNGSTYSVPSEGESNWADNVANYLIAIASGSLQKSGGSFTLTAEVDFGANYGLKSSYIKSRATNPASAGVLRLGNAESIKWRNQANNADLDLTVNSSDVLQFNGSSVLMPGIGSIVNADISNSAAIAYSKLNLTGNIVNADISNSAAIAYSKLNLSTSIVNTDISTSAAIAYSKLNLSGSILNADINASAAIAYSKLNLTNSISNADISSSAAIAYSKLNIANNDLTIAKTNGLQTALDSKVDKSTLTTKGDIYVATASATIARQGIGSDGQILVADSSQANGLKWSTISGGVNYILNPGAEASTTGWAAYADAAGSNPVDGTGGTPNSTWTRSTTSPLHGSGMFIFTHNSGASRQGEGASYDFTIDSGDKAKVLQIEFDYQLVSGTFTAGSDSLASDLTVWIYDVTNSTLIQPSTYKLFSNSSTLPTKFISNFQSSANSTSYRLIIHCGSTSTSAFVMSFDDFKVAPCQYVYGTPITDWASYTPTVSNLGTGSSTTNVAKYRRVGDSMETMVTFQKDGSGGSGASVVTWSFPSGLSADATKLPFGSATAKADNIGSAWVVSGGNYSASDYEPLVNSATTFAISKPTTSTQLTGADIPASTYIIFRATVPITGWSSSTQVSDGYDGRQIAASFSTNAGAIATSATTWTTVTFSTPDFDTTSSWNGSDTYTAPSSGVYELGISAGQNSAAANYFRTGYRINSGTDVVLGQAIGKAGGSAYFFASRKVKLNAGDTIQFRALTEGTEGIASTRTAFIKKESSPQTMSATEVVAASYRISADKTPSASNPIDYDTKIFDTHNAVTTGSSWKFTAPVPGLYRVTTTNATSTTGGILDLYVNGSQDRGMMSMSDTSVRSASATVSLLAGGYISINPDSASKTFTGTKNNTIYIERIK